MNSDEYERMYRLEDTYWWFVARRRLIAALLRDLMPPGPIDMLDIGCGTGAMLDELRTYGRVVGADFSEEALAFCRQRGARSGLEYELVRADARALPFAANSFDVVTAMDIIEHIDRDKDALREIWRVLRPGGHLLATVPAYQSLWSDHDVALHHHRRYTGPQFRDLVQRSGFDIERLSYTVSSLLPAVWVFRQVNRLLHFRRRGGAPKADLVSVPPKVNHALVNLLEMETNFVRKRSLPFGVTVLVVAKKPEHSP